MDNELRTTQVAQNVLQNKEHKPLLRRVLPLLGPAFISSGAYFAPGYFGTDSRGGAAFG